MVEGLKSQLRSLEVELSDYERLQTGVRQLEVSSFAELPTALIKMRIARQWTQAELARRMDLPEQQIQRYEADVYKGVAWDRLSEIASVLGIRLDARLRLPDATNLDPLAVAVWRRAGLALLLREIKDLRGRPVQGRMDLQKLLVLWSDVVTSQLGAPIYAHKAWNYGAFDDEVLRDIEFLEAEGLVGVESSSTSYQRAHGNVLKKALRHLRAEAKDETYELTKEGLRWLRKFLESDAYGGPEQKRSLAGLASDLAKRYGNVPLDRLIEETYKQFPSLAERSLIKDKVLSRIRKRARP
jgi:transcriptional regulator with XRE-family HTH domain